MKKNLSFLQKLGVTAASIALIGGLAWAGTGSSSVPEGMEEVWTVPATIDANKAVTFVGVKSDGAYQFANDFASSTKVSDDGLADGTDYEFTVVGTTDNYLTFKGVDGKYLTEDGTVETHDLTSEVKWSYTSPYLAAKSNDRYLYYSQSADKFATSTDQMGAILFQKGNVYKPTITLSEDADKYTDDKTATDLAIRVSSTIKPTVTIADPESKLESDKQNTKMYYSIDCSDDTKDVAETEATADVTVNLADYADETVTINVYTKVFATANGSDFVISKTSTVSKTYNVVALEDPTLEASSTRLSTKTADADNKLTVQVNKNGRASVAAVNTTTTTGIVNTTWTDGKKAKNVVDYVGKTIDAAVQSSLNGVTTDKIAYTVEVLPNLSTEEVTALFGTIDPDPAADSRVEGGTEVTLKYEVETDEQKIYTISPNADKIKVNVTVGAATEATEVEATKNAAGDGYTFTLPTALYTEGFKVEVPAEAFKAEATLAPDPTSTDPYVNTFLSPAATFNYKNAHDGQTFEIDPVTSKIDTDATANFDFTITAPSGTEVTCADLSQVKVTNSLNEDVKTTSPYTVTYVAATTDVPAHYNVAFSGSLAADDYMVVFPKCTLLDEKDITNADNVTAYINVMPKVDFAYFLSNDPAATEAPERICTSKDLYVVVKPTVEDNVRMSSLVRGAAKPSLYCAKDKTTQDIELEEVETTPNVYKVTTDLKDFYSHFTKNYAVKLTVPAGLFQSDNTLCPEATCTTAAWHHVTYSLASDEPVIVDKKATSFSFGLKAVNDADVNLAIPGTYKVKFNGNDVDMEVGSLDATTGVSTATVSGDFTSLADGDYTLTIAENTLNINSSDESRYCRCPNDQLDVTVKVGTVGYTFAAVEGITTEDDEFQMTASYSLDGVVNPATLVNATPVADAVDVEGVKGQITDYDATTGVYTVKLASKLARKAEGAAYTVTVAAGVFQSGTGSTNDGTETFTLNVEQYVVFGMASDKFIAEANDEPTTFQFAIATSPLDIDGKDIAVALNDINGVAVKDGETSYPAKTVEYAGEDEDHNSLFNVTLESALVPNNYMLSIAPEALKALNNTNPDKLQCTLQVFKKVNFALNPAEFAIDTNTDEVATFIKATDKDDVSYDIPVTDVTAKISLNGEEVSSQEYKVDGNAYVANNLKKLVEANGVGTYTYVIPAGSFKVNASTNEELTFTVDIKNAAEWVTPTDLTINEKPATITIPVSQIQKTEGIDLIINPDYTLPMQIELSSDGADWTGDGMLIDNVEVDGDNIVITLDADESAKELVQGAYARVRFTADYLKAGNTVNVEPIIVNLTIQKNLVFNDNFTNEEGVKVETTTVADVTPFVGSTVDNLTYNRTFSNAAYSAFCVPFNVKASDVTGASIIRLNDVAVQEGVLTFYYTTLTADETAYANMPYVILPEAAGNLSLSLANVAIVAPEEKSVESSTTKDNYVFTGTNTAKTPSKALEYYTLVKSGAIKAVSTKASVAPWRWIMTTTSKNLEYAKVVVDGVEVSDDEATAIMNIEADDYSDAKVYNVGGQRLSTASKGHVNIVNGKKIFVK